jgi:hypothetical protein
MITIGYSTRSHKPEFIDYLKTAAGHPKVQIIEKVNNGEKSLSQVYNEIIEESEFDIVVLCHDDIYFDSKKFATKVYKNFEDSDYGILGVAGTTELPKSGMWWEGRKMLGIVNHEHEGKKWENKYCENVNDQIRSSVIVDGLFMCLHKKRIKHLFDETVEGFHFYDVTFCFNNFLDKVRIGVMFNIRITHLSIGMTNESWEKNRNIFSEKYSSFLPARSNPNEKERFRILIAFPNLENQPTQQMLIFNLIETLKKMGNQVFIVSELSEPLSRKFKKIGIQSFPLREPPGFKIGDGKSIIQNADGSTHIAKPNELYFISDQTFDYILVQNEQIYGYMKNLYPTVFKQLIVLDSESYKKPIEDDLLVNYLGESETVVNNFIDFFKIDKEKIFEIKNDNILKSLIW